MNPYLDHGLTLEDLFSAHDSALDWLATVNPVSCPGGMRLEHVPTEALGEYLEHWHVGELFHVPTGFNPDTYFEAVRAEDGHIWAVFIPSNVTLAVRALGRKSAPNTKSTPTRELVTA